MNSNGENSRQYSAEDIRRYVQGEMSSAEMHGIEKAALDDPFLADAIEGYSESVIGAGLPAVETGRAILQKEFEERIQSTKKQAAPVIRMKWWQAATAAAVIVCAGVLSYNSWMDGEPGAPVVSANETRQVPEAAQLQANDTVSNTFNSDSAIDERPSGVLSLPEKKEQPALSEAPLAMNKAEQAKEKMREQSASRKKSGKAAGNADAANDENTADQALRARQIPNATPAKPAPSQSTPSQSTPPQSAPPQSAPPQSAPAKPVEDRAAAEKDMALSSDQAAVSKSKSITIIQKSAADTKIDNEQQVGKALQGKIAGVEITKTQAKKEANADALMENMAVSKKMLYYQGKVLSNDNKPLSNAILKLTDQKKAYSTDNNGNFIIPSVDSVISFDVTMVGKNPTRFTLNSTSGYNQLILPDAANELSEVIVVGYGTQKKRSVTSSTSVLNPSVFNAAPVSGWPGLQEYFEKNKNKDLNKSPGAPTDVHFRVDKNGALAGFRVTRSISPEHDKEAIRLVKEGPAWKLIKGRKADITVTIIF